MCWQSVEKESEREGEGGRGARQGELGDKRGRQEEPENERQQITGEKEGETEANTKRTTRKNHTSRAEMKTNQEVERGEHERV